MLLDNVEMKAMASQIDWNYSTDVDWISFEVNSKRVHW